MGPNATFLRYVEEVVPSLGEDRVVLATPAELGPDVPVGRPDSDAAARVKGGARMAAVLAKAVADRERVPKREVAIPCGRFVLRLEHDDLRRVVARARRASGTHNARRRLVERGVVALLQQALDRAVPRSMQHAGVGSRSDARPVDELVERVRVMEVVDAVWPTLTPEQLLRFLYGVPRRLRARRSERGRGAPPSTADDGDERWTEADVALLDELEVLLRPLPTSVAAAAAVDPMVERILADLVPDCPRCGAELTFVTSGAEPGRDRLRCDTCGLRRRAGDVRVTRQRSTCGVCTTRSS